MKRIYIQMDLSDEKFEEAKIKGVETDQDVIGHLEKDLKEEGVLDVKVTIETI